MQIPGYRSYTLTIEKGKYPSLKKALTSCESHDLVLPAPPNSKHFVGSAYPEHFDILVFLWQSIFLSMRKGA